AAIYRRLKVSNNRAETGPIRVFSDGRDPEVQGEVFPLPRRERRILEYLMANRGKRVAKTQIFSAIYGLFDEAVEENVVESHISKLRKKLRNKLGFDPVDSKRFLGYSIDWN
nr:response regulator transcription factor [Candidatus Liberibacter asiaticus]